jgi:O-antigen/teichoic acid export membrane protein
MVLARLLTPADFGIIAMATIVIAFLDSITNAGLNLYVLRQQDNNQRVFNTAWTLSIVQGILVAMPLVLCAHWIADFYSQPELTQVIYCLALSRIIQGGNSIGIVIAQKQMDFKVEFKFTLITRITYLLATITFALYYQSYWALAFGQLVSAFIGFVVSYHVHSFRPQFSLYLWREFVSFSKHTLPFSFGRYVNNQLDVAVIGRMAMAEFVGLYHVATNLASLFTKELLIPVVRGLIPNLAVQIQSKNFKHVLATTFTSAVYVFLPIGVGLSILSKEIVEVLLGDQWQAAAPMLQWFSLYAMLGGMMMFFSEQFLVIMDKEALSNKLMWFRNAVLIVTLTVVFSLYNVSMLPLALFISALLVFPIVLVTICSALKLSLLNLIQSWSPAIVSVMFMVLILNVLPNTKAPILIPLVYKSLFGMIGYIGCLLGLYFLRGRPSNSLENMLLTRIRNFTFFKS